MGSLFALRGRGGCDVQKRRDSREGAGFYTQPPACTRLSVVMFVRLLASKMAQVAFRDWLQQSIANSFQQLRFIPHATKAIPQKCKPIRPMCNSVSAFCPEVDSAYG